MIRSVRFGSRLEGERDPTHARATAMDLPETGYAQVRWDDTSMRTVTAAVGTSLFLALAPGVVTGLIPVGARALGGSSQVLATPSTPTFGFERIQDAELKGLPGAVALFRVTRTRTGRSTP